MLFCGFLCCVCAREHVLLGVQLPGFLAPQGFPMDYLDSGLGVDPVTMVKRGPASTFM